MMTRDHIPGANKNSKARAWLSQWENSPCFQYSMAQPSNSSPSETQMDVSFIAQTPRNASGQVTVECFKGAPGEQECILTLPKMLLHNPLAARFVFILLQHC